jgi:glycine hydroxymethyltransferase
MFEFGFKVQASEFGFTESHQLAVDVAEFGGGDKVARHLKDNHIILNMNLLPHDPQGEINRWSGIRIGVQEMTRFGMREAEMERIAVLLQKCLMSGKYIGDEVSDLRKQFQEIQYSFDGETGVKTEPFQIAAESS